METLGLEESYSVTDEIWESENDISQLCRLCANHNQNLIPIFKEEGLEHELESKISQHLPIQVREDDPLPANICYQCASLLISWHDLVAVCVKSEEKFNRLTTKDSDNTVKDDKLETIEISKQNKSPVKKEKTILIPAESIFQGYPAAPNLVIEDVTSMVTDDGSLNARGILFYKEDEGEEQLDGEEQFNEKQQNEEQLNDEEELYDEDLFEEEPYGEEPFGEENYEEMVGIVEEPEEEEEHELVNEGLLIATGENGEDDTIQSVEFFNNVSTPVVVHNLVDGLDGGEYIAYITDEFGDGSVRVLGQEFQVANMKNDSKPYVCETCNSIYSDAIAFKNHLLSHKVKGHFCDYCNVYYKRIDHLEKHIELMHPTFAKELVKREKKVNPYAKSFLCNTCGKILKSSLAYENHTLKHQSKCPFLCDLCPESFPNRGARRKHEVKEHGIFTKENGNPDGYHVCEVCGVEMFSDGAYYHHKDKHGDPYPCGFCGKLYGSRSLMQVHARRHTTDRPFVCTVCNRNFKVKQELNAHMNIHRDVRPYQCPHCPKMCRKSSDLTHHIRTHTGEKPYICDKCGRGFAQAGDMRKHRLLHFRPSKVNKNLAIHKTL